MPDTVLVRRGTVVQKWCNTPRDRLDASAHDGDLIEVVGEVAPGMTYRDGAFLSAPPVITAEQIKAEAERRAGVFPKGLHAFLLRSPAGPAVLGYLLGVQDTAQRFLAMDRAPADFCDHRHWPDVPDVSASNVPMAAPQPLVSLPAPSPQEVRVVVDHRQPPVLDMQPVTVPVRWEMPTSPSSAAFSRVVPDSAVSPGAVAAEIATDDELASIKRIVKAAIETTYDAHKGEFADPDAHNAWLQQLATMFVEVDLSTTVAGVLAAQARAEKFIRGAA